MKIDASINNIIKIEIFIIFLFSNKSNMDFLGKLINAIKDAIELSRNIAKIV